MSETLASLYDLLSNKTLSVKIYKGFVSSRNWVKRMVLVPWCPKLYYIWFYQGKWDTCKMKKKKNSWSLQRQLIGIQPVNHKIQSYNTEQDPTIFFCCWFKSCYLYINLYSHNKDTPLYILSGFGFFAFNYSHIHQIRVLERRSNPSSCFEIWFTY